MERDTGRRHKPPPTVSLVNNDMFRLLGGPPRSASKPGVVVAGPTSSSAGAVPSFAQVMGNKVTTFPSIVPTKESALSKSLASPSDITASYTFNEEADTQLNKTAPADILVPSRPPNKGKNNAKHVEFEDNVVDDVAYYFNSTGVSSGGNQSANNNSSSILDDIVSKMNFMEDKMKGLERENTSLKTELYRMADAVSRLNVTSSDLKAVTDSERREMDVQIRLTQKQGEVAMEEFMEKHAKLLSIIDKQSRDIMELREVTVKNEKKNIDLASMVAVVRDALTSGEIKLDFHNDVANLKKVIQTKDSEDSSFKEQEKKKFVLLFSEVTKLSEKLNKLEMAQGKSVDNTLERIESLERRNKNADEIILELNQKSSLKFDTSEKVLRDTDMKVSHVNEAVGSLRELLSREIDDRKRLQEAHYRWLDDIKTSLLKLDKETAERLTNALGLMNESVQATTQTSAQRFNEAREDEERRRISDLEKSNSLFEQINRRFADLERVLGEEIETRAVSISNGQGIWESKYSALNLALRKEEASRMASVSDLATELSNGLREVRQVMDASHNEKDGSLESLENILRAEIKARMRRNEETDKKFDGLKSGIKDIVTELRDDTAAKISEITVKVISKNNETTNKFLSFQDKTQHMVHELAQNVAKEIDNMQSSITELNEREVKVKEQDDKAILGLTALVESAVKDTKEKMETVQTVVRHNQVSLEEHIKQVGVKSQQNLQEFKEESAMAMTKQMNAKSAEITKLRTDHAALIDQVRSDLSSHEDITTERFRAVHNRMNDFKIELDVYDVVANMLDQLDNLSSDNSTVAIRHDLEELAVTREVQHILNNIIDNAALGSLEKDLSTRHAKLMALVDKSELTIKRSMEEQLKLKESINETQRMLNVKVAELDEQVARQGKSNETMIASERKKTELRIVAENLVKDSINKNIISGIEKSTLQEHVELVTLRKQYDTLSQEHQEQQKEIKALSEQFGSMLHKLQSQQSSEKEKWNQTISLATDFFGKDVVSLKGDGSSTSAGSTAAPKVRKINFKRE